MIHLLISCRVKVRRKQLVLVDIYLADLFPLLNEDLSI